MDTGSTVFTLVLPPVSLDRGSKAQVTAQGITTVHRRSPIQAMNRGQMIVYQPAALTGTAAFVMF